MNDRQRLEAIVDVVRSYLPPDGISREEAMSRIIELVDPLPAQPEQEPVAWMDKNGVPSTYKSELYSIPLYTLHHSTTQGLIECTHNRYSYDVTDDEATCRDCGAQGRMIFVVNGTAPVSKPEPVAVWELQEDGWNTIADAEWMETLPFGTKLYTAPPSKPWVSLTDEEMEKATRMSVDELLDHIYENGTTTEGVGYRVNRIVKAIEAALRSKNNG